MIQVHLRMFGEWIWILLLIHYLALILDILDNLYNQLSLDHTLIILILRRIHLEIVFCLNLFKAIPSAIFVMALSRISKNA